MSDNTPSLSLSLILQHVAILITPAISTNPWFVYTRVQTVSIKIALFDCPPVRLIWLLKPEWLNLSHCFNALNLSLNQTDMTLTHFV